MQTYEILVKERAIRPNSKDMTLVRTSIGIDQLHVLFDNPEWLDFPITITFAQGEDIVSQPLQVTAVADSEWVAEGTVTIPHEVIDMLGPIRVTLQGTDANGRHIITAKGSPLSVEEAGDVIQGIEPSDNPTMDEWYQAYANAVAAANAAASLVANLQAQLDSMVSDAEAVIDTKVGESYRPATRTELGTIMVGDGLSITDDGVLSANAKQSGQSIDVSDLYGLADAAFDNPFETPVVKSNVLPIATMDSLGAIYPDGTSITVDNDGMIHAVAAYIPVATSDTAGIVRPDGTTLTIDEYGTLHGTPIATTNIAGKVKPDGTTLTIDEDGALHGVEQTPIATSSVTGKVKPDGTTLTIDEDGTLHGVEQTPIATSSVTGKVKPDGTTLTIDEDGTLHGVEQTPIATSSVTGKVKPDGTTITVDDDGTIHGISSGGVVQETDPTVPAWAKRSKKPEYTPDEVGAVASTDVGIPNGVAGLDDDGLVPLSQLPPLTESVATNESVGVVKPDGTTIVVSDNGELSVAKKTSTVVATQASSGARKGDFSYIVVRIDTYYVNYQIRNISNLYLDLAINNNHFIRNFDISGRNSTLDKVAIVIYSTGKVCLSTYGTLAGQWFYSQYALITLGTFDALSSSNDNDIVRVSSARLDYGTYYNSNSATMTLFSFISERYVAGIPVDNDTIKLNEHGIMRTNIRVSSPLTYTNGVIYLPIDNSLGYIGTNSALSVNIPYIFERLNVYSSELITFTEDDESPTIDIRTATPESPGIVRPDNKTTFMDGDKITVKSYDDTIDDLQRKVNALMRRVKALEDELGLDTMTYDNGTLYVNSTYEDGTLVTSRTYEDGTLL